MDGEQVAARITRRQLLVEVCGEPSRPINEPHTNPLSSAIHRGMTRVPSWLQSSSSLA